MSVKLKLSVKGYDSDTISGVGLGWELISSVFIEIYLWSSEI
jgi:hypothetical protein